MKNIQGKVYLVGGAVRDILMDKTPKDRDYVVVGGSQENLLSLGFKQVGVGFPVFLHPETNEEYALARTEKKSGVGYNGFTVETENLNPKLLEKFVLLGYIRGKEYPINDLMESYRHINQFFDETLQ